MIDHLLSCLSFDFFLMFLLSLRAERARACSMQASLGLLQCVNQHFGAVWVGRALALLLVLGFSRASARFRLYWLGSTSGSVATHVFLKVFRPLNVFPGTCPLVFLVL